MARVGIDLGTCNSVVTTMEDGRVIVVNNAEGRQTTPSVVFFNSSSLDDAFVGQNAVFAANNNPARAARFIKKQMGTDFRFPIDDKSYSPEEISAAILRKLIQDAKVELGEEITDVVITVPAWFEQRQRDATVRAGEALGVTVRAVFPEPIAAAIDYAQAKTDDLAGKTFLVYDLGGGTFDTTLIKVEDESSGDSLGFRVLNKAGSIDLGGYNWDRMLHDYVAQRFSEAHGKSPGDDPISSDLLLLKCQEAKEALSSMPPDVPFKIACRHEGLEFEVSMTRTEFETLTAPLLNESIDKVAQLVEETYRPMNPDASVEQLWDNVDIILLAGGSTKMPAVIETLERLSGKKSVTNRGVDLNVGRGAAYVMFSPDAWVVQEGLDDTPSGDEATQPGQDGQPMRTIRDVLESQGPKKRIRAAVDTATQGLGICVVDPTNPSRDINAVVIPAGSPVGQEVVETFYIFQDGQTAVDVVINASAAGLTPDEQRDLALVERLGSARISGLPPTTRAGEEITVRLMLNGNGLITGTATHVPSQREARIEVKLQLKQFVAEGA